MSINDKLGNGEDTKGTVASIKSYWNKKAIQPLVVQLIYIYHKTWRCNVNNIAMGNERQVEYYILAIFIVENH